MSPTAEGQARLNRIWSRTILEELTRFGVRHVCIAPGSRSTPLTLEAEANAKLTLHTHFDERGLGFLALGLAKAANGPVAVIVTSGTAVANLLPAVAESGLTREKLVLLTADRPQELIDCGANQAIVQTGIFSSHATDALNLPSPSERVSLNWLLSSVDQKMFTQRDKGGSVHINCPFPEPLYGESGDDGFSQYSDSVQHWQSGQDTYIHQPQHQVVSQLQQAGLSEKKGVIVLGNISLDHAQQARVLADKLGWPLLCDPQSGISSDWAYYDIWLQNGKAAEKLSECDCIIQLGARLVSKRLDAFIKSRAGLGDAEYILVSEHNQRLNPNHLVMSAIYGDTGKWINAQIHSFDEACVAHKGWAEDLCSYSEMVSEQVSGDKSLTELQLAGQLNDITLPESLFIGNSLIVRLIDMVGKLDSKQVFTNRGASGIDGLVATAVGVQKAKDQPLLALLGDTSLLYDLNSLALCNQVTQPVVIIVTNNDGGAIFDLLPVPEQQKRALYQMPHGFDFEHAAMQFGLKYLKPETMEAVHHATSEHFSHGSGALLVEIQTPPEQATKAVKTLVAKINA